MTLEQCYGNMTAINGKDTKLGIMLREVSYLHSDKWKLLPLQGARQDVLIPRVLPGLGASAPSGRA